MPNSSSLTELFVDKSLSLRALGYLKEDNIYQYLVSFDCSKTSIQGFLLFNLELLSYPLCYF